VNAKRNGVEPPLAFPNTATRTVEEQVQTRSRAYDAFLVKLARKAAPKPGPQRDIIVAAISLVVAHGQSLLALYKAVEPQQWRMSDKS
jgi:hypothetical protein